MNDEHKKILVVEDQDEIREIIGLSLEQVMNWQVVFADPGLSAIRCAEVEHPDAILLDAKMPVMDGPTTFRALSANRETRKIPVVLLTASVQKTDLEEFAKIGFTAVLTKPFDPSLLPKQFADALGWQIADEANDSLQGDSNERS